MNKILTGDCLRHLASLPEGIVDLAFADPPFNIGYEYDVYNDRQTKADYLAWTEQWLKAVRRVLKPAGSFFVAIGDEYAAELKIRLDALGLTLRNWIVWHYTFGVNCQQKFNRSHAHILYYVMDPRRFTFNADEIRVPSARQTTYADRRANPRGKLPDDTWVLRPQEDASCFPPDSDTWYVRPRLRHVQGKDRPSLSDAGSRAGAHYPGLQPSRRAGAWIPSPAAAPPWPRPSASDGVTSASSYRKNTPKRFSSGWSARVVDRRSRNPPLAA